MVKHRETCCCCVHTHMQYINIELKDTLHIMDAKEIQLLEEKQKFTVDSDESKHVDQVVYGAVLMNNDVSSDDAIAKLTELKGYGFISFGDDGVAYMSELVDFVVGEPLTGFRKVPIVAHLKTAVPMPTATQNSQNVALTFSLWLSNLDPFGSILKRKFLLAIVCRADDGKDAPKALEEVDHQKLHEIAESVGCLKLEDNVS